MRNARPVSVAGGLVTRVSMGHGGQFVGGGVPGVVHDQIQPMSANR